VQPQLSTAPGSHFNFLGSNLKNNTTDPLSRVVEIEFSSCAKDERTSYRILVLIFGTKLSLLPNDLTVPKSKID